MDLLLIIVLNILFVSLLTNIFLFIKSRKKVIKKESYEVRELLADLAQGGALLEIRRVDPNSVFMKSPREMN